MKRWIVWQNADKLEGVVTDEEEAARLAADGFWNNGGSTLLHDFLKMHEDEDESFVLEEIEIPDAEPTMQFTYKNHRGDIALRTVTSVTVFHGTTEYYPEPQWLMRAMDQDRGEERVFAMANILDFQRTT